MPTADDFRVELTGILQRAELQGRPHVEINAGELHRSVGGYPSREGNQHAMPSCCGVMRGELEAGKAEIIYTPESGNGASLTIRYYLPRLHLRN
ncbi:MAG: endonuclease [Proteobacteria bacterium]|nr:endonuclease [Pseudomonadota bacterium]